MAVELSPEYFGSPWEHAAHQPVSPWWGSGTPYRECHRRVMTWHLCRSVVLIQAKENGHTWARSVWCFGLFARGGHIAEIVIASSYRGPRFARSATHPGMYSRGGHAPFIPPGPPCASVEPPFRAWRPGGVRVCYIHANVLSLIQGCPGCASTYRFTRRFVVPAGRRTPLPAPLQANYRWNIRCLGPLCSIVRCSMWS